MNPGGDEKRDNFRIHLELLWKAAKMRQVPINSTDQTAAHNATFVETSPTRTLSISGRYVTSQDEAYLYHTGIRHKKSKAKGKDFQNPNNPSIHSKKWC